MRCGVGLFCVAPGSRSTPLVAALASNPRARKIIHFDERGTAFAALGYARATGQPAAWITTSGTAVANGLPAIVEASVDSVPMILLTADRPPELRQTGANQTIDQPDIFGDFVRWSFDLPAPDPDTDPAMVLTTVDQAVYRARRSPSGPVHLNLMFREPFLPNPNKPSKTLEPPEPWSTNAEPYTRYAPTKSSVDESEIETLQRMLQPIERGLVVAGRLTYREQGEAVKRLAKDLGWPLLPDIGSQARLGVGDSAAFYDALLANEKFAASYAPEAVLHVGGRTLSKRLEKFVGRGRLDPYIVIRDNPFRLDQSHRVTHSVETNVVDFCDALSQALPERAPSDWLSGWREASEDVEQRFGELLLEDGDLSEPVVARVVSRHVPEGHGLVVASSMPVRDLDTFAVTDGAFVPVAANRGASGIDGTVATAAGFACGLDSPVTLVIGDLALLHDLNSLAMLRDLPVTVVVVNNDGGGIFSFLPVAGEREFFEPYFGTPQGVGFESAAAMFGLGYENPKTAAEFVRAYRSAVSGQTSTLIEVNTNRDENVTLHNELLCEVSERDPA